MQIDHDMTLEDRHNINPANSTSINQGDYYELYTLMELHFFLFVFIFILGEEFTIILLYIFILEQR